MTETPAGGKKRAGVTGWPVEHSLSPRVHGHWLKKHHIDGEYIRLPIAPETFEAELRALAAAGFKGVNVTVPHKQAAARLCDELDAAARTMGAANTLTFYPGGRITGANTDGYGFMQNLRAGAPTWDAARPAVMLGAGGAARAVRHALAEAGCPEIRIINRTRAHAEELAASSADTGSGDARVVDWAERGAALNDAGLLVNATTLGMTGQAPLEINLSAAPEDCVVTDIVYTPLETPLLAAARRRGMRAVDGLGMLLHQAKPGFEAWFGAVVEVDEDLRAHVLGQGGAL
ncbi:MAG: shikimate dehydrogenase [Rhodospirillales bacterium]